MAMPFDATLKTMLENSPADWCRLGGYRVSDVAVIDADTSTVTGAADKLLHIRDDPSWLYHLDFQAGPDAAKPRKLNIYSSVLEDRHELPVRTGLVLLCPQANLRSYNGLYESFLPGEAIPYRSFRYQVIRIWELPVETFLSGGIGLMPLAPISAVPEPEVKNVIREMKQRLESKKYRAKAAQIWTCSFVLMGLRFAEPFARQLLAGVMDMKESTTYQGIYREGKLEGKIEGKLEGKVEELQTLLIKAATWKLGPADSRITRKVTSTTDLPTLDAIFDRIPLVSSWDELLASTKPKRRPGKS